MNCACKYHTHSFFIIILVLIFHLLILITLAIWIPDTLKKNFLPAPTAEVILQQTPLEEWVQLNATHHHTPNDTSKTYEPQEHMKQEISKTIPEYEEEKEETSPAEILEDNTLSEVTDDIANNEPTHKTAIVKDLTHQFQEKPRPLPFSQLLQGALAQWNQGTDHYTMQGKKTGKATAEQLKRAAYFTKIMESIRSSLITHTIHKPLCTAEARMVIVAFSLLPKGGIDTISIHTSSGNRHIDLFIIRIVKDAASSFPPVPKTFNPQDHHVTVRFNDIIHLIEHPHSAHISV